MIGTFDDPIEYLYFGLILWACYLFSEQQTMAILMIVKDHLIAAICSIYVTSVCITLSSGILRYVLKFKPNSIQQRHSKEYLRENKSHFAGNTNETNNNANIFLYT